MTYHVRIPYTFVPFNVPHSFLHSVLVLVLPVPIIQRLFFFDIICHYNFLLRLLEPEKNFPQNTVKKPSLFNGQRAHALAMEYDIMALPLSYPYYSAPSPQGSTSPYEQPIYDWDIAKPLYYHKAKS